ncbi:hypothetical protein, partial [Duganella phyllosphaerae]|uniref:hypothetical protein n=1 Tax=Duganella phyllosphaerae TaxID=762836 RepID=UPI001ABF2D3B
SNVHTYRLLIFKELYSVLHFAAIVLSAAKKKEYEAFSLFRQPSFSYFSYLRFTLQQLEKRALFCEGANHSKGHWG